MMQSVLIVDDEPLNIDVFKDAFRRWSLEIRGASSGAEALEALQHAIGAHHVFQGY